MVCIIGRSIEIWYQMGDSPEIRLAPGGDWERLLAVIHHLRHCWDGPLTSHDHSEQRKEKEA
jgi:hypothetical protein